jgi:hypothetical protein
MSLHQDVSYLRGLITRRSRSIRSARDIIIKTKAPSHHACHPVTTFSKGDIKVTDYLPFTTNRSDAIKEITIVRVPAD